MALSRAGASGPESWVLWVELISQSRESAIASCMYLQRARYISRGIDRMSADFRPTLRALPCPIKAERLYRTDGGLLPETRPMFLNTLTQKRSPFSGLTTINTAVTGASAANESWVLWVKLVSHSRESVIASCICGVRGTSLRVNRMSADFGPLSGRYPAQSRETLQD